MRLVYYLGGAAILILSIIVLSTLYPYQSMDEPPLLKGYMRLTDSGVSGGGFEWVGEYNLTIVYEGGDITLKINMFRGLGDYIERHVYRVDELSIDGEYLHLVIEGREYRLVKGVDGKYRAVSSDRPDEVIGVIDPYFLEGVPQHFYIEIVISSQ